MFLGAHRREQIQKWEKKLSRTRIALQRIKGKNSKQKIQNTNNEMQESDSLWFGRRSFAR